MRREDADTLRLARGIAHDLSNMLAAIQGSASLLEGVVPPGSPGEEERRLILEATRKADQMVQRLFRLAHGGPPAPCIIDLHVLLQGLVDFLERVVGPGIELQVHLAPGAATVLADPHQLERVLVNLALNARDAMPEGGSLRLETRLLPADRGGAARVRLHVRDTGHGIPDEDLALVFEPFFTTKGAARGTGLGLSTIADFARRAGGTVRAVPGQAEGALFELILPLVG